MHGCMAFAEGVNKMPIGRNSPVGRQQNNIYTGRIAKMIKLDDYEKELLESFEKGEWESVKNKDEEIRKYRQYAAGSLKKDKRVSFKITSKDLEDIQEKAIAEGLNHEVLIASIIHKYNTGQLVER